jgi:hypothetical protein
MFCKFVALACLSLAIVAKIEVPQHLLNEWAEFKEGDDFDAFLEMGSKTADAGGDFEFKCETTCQLVQKSATAASGAPAAKASSFLETESTTSDAGGDFEFKCETTCQLVQKSATAGAATSAPSGASRAAAAAAAHNFLQTEAGLGVGEQAQQQVQQQQQEQVQVQTKAKTSQVKDCYRLCLNPSMNPGCDAASSVVSLLETGSTTEDEVVRKNWSLGSGSGNCLNSCVHVCMAVHDSVTP